jgi:hypothetical protein
VGIFSFPITHIPTFHSFSASKMSQKPNVLILGEACRFFPESAQVIDEDAMAFFLFRILIRRAEYRDSSFGSFPSAVAG